MMFRKWLWIIVVSALSVLVIIFTDAWSTVDTYFDIVNGRYKTEYRFGGIKYKKIISERVNHGGSNFTELVDRVNANGAPEWIAIGTHFSGIKGWLIKVQISGANAEIAQCYTEFALLTELEEVDNVSSAIEVLRNLARENRTEELKVFIEDLNSDSIESKHW